ncbi:MAG TPA: undecaprenyl-phosphate glucose phosphotransferase [Candidatus Eisenbacteria bacterium]|nr:undecaprenyl-phosphate glucose phosphotransferase [Candidatus Eisenbacteria bacterium]
MFARNRQLQATAIFMLDGVLIAGAWLAAYWLRFYALGIPAPLGIPSLAFHLWVGAVLTPVALLVLRTFRLYRSARTARLTHELFVLAEGVVVVTALAGLGSFFARGELPRSVLLIFAALMVALLWTSRIVLRLVLRAMRRRGRNLRYVMVVGTGEQAERLVRKFEQHPDYGIVINGLVTADPAQMGATVAGVPVLGTIADLPGVVERTGTDFVYLALARSEWEAEEEALARLSDSTVAVRLVPDLVRAFTLNAAVEDFEGMPVVLVTETPEQGWNAVIKRTFDLAFSAAGLIVLSPLMAAVALWVRLDSPGPVLYGQERVGVNGRRFRMWKFRTMRADAEAEGAAWTTADDPRRTRAGGTLRKLSLDELPQLWNVLRGHMSLVGPRPEQPVYVDRFRASIPRYMLRHHVKAGMTGWAQVNGLRGDTPLERRIEYDLYYIENWSLGFDLRIIALTFVRVFRDASAY